MVLIITAHAGASGVIKRVKLDEPLCDSIKVLNLPLKIADHIEYDSCVVHLPHATIAINDPLSPAAGLWVLPFST